MISHSFFYLVPRNKTKDRSHHIAWQDVRVELTAVSDYTRSWGKVYNLRAPNENYSVFDHRIQQTLRSENNNKRKYSYHEAYEEIKGIREVR